MQHVLNYLGQLPGLQSLLEAVVTPAGLCAIFGGSGAPCRNKAEARSTGNASTAIPRCCWLTHEPALLRGQSCVDAAKAWVEVPSGMDAPLPDAAVHFQPWQAVGHPLQASGEPCLPPTGL